MWIVIFLLVAAVAAGCMGTLVYLLLNGHWWQAGLLCLVVWGLWSLAKATHEPWHRGPQ